jgi:hypothetical protein
MAENVLTASTGSSCTTKMGAKRISTMKPLAYKYIPILAPVVMGLILAGCQQAPPAAASAPASTSPAPASTPQTTSSTVEHSSSSSSETKAADRPDGAPAVQSTESQQSTTVEKKKE